ncbi:addiction module toxin, HicA family [Scytonema sp. UIC 10036]|uniref:element excision factor XisI family protein n=1 Tax=Scytonema sp. UIC 10036 TaxID=2304196 RepID=UPI0012DA62F0|nr:element excision factor XisI family protein [Scytonema sp. UIC 10036]MUG92566.1 addiction module toxin, HicA family [Scytonema sp. UIC 10036]
MSNYPSVKAKDFIRVIEQLGFYFDHQKGSHAIYKDIYIRLKDEKIWIEEDWTENGVATDLLLKGIPKEEIVLAFHPLHVRQYTEFASA